MLLLLPLPVPSPSSCGSAHLLLQPLTFVPIVQRRRNARYTESGVLQQASGACVEIYCSSGLVVNYCGLLTGVARVYELTGSVKMQHKIAHTIVLIHGHDPGFNKPYLSKDLLKKIRLCLQRVNEVNVCLFIYIYIYWLYH